MGVLRGLPYCGSLILVSMWIVGWVQLWRRSRQEGVPMKKIREELKRD